MVAQRVSSSTRTSEVEQGILSGGGPGGHRDDGKGVSQEAEPVPYPEPPPPIGQYASTVPTWPLEVSMVAV